MSKYKTTKALYRKSFVKEVFELIDNSGFPDMSKKELIAYATELHNLTVDYSYLSPLAREYL